MDSGQLSSISGLAWIGLNVFVCAGHGPINQKRISLSLNSTVQCPSN